MVQSYLKNPLLDVMKFNIKFLAILAISQLAGCIIVPPNNHNNVSKTKDETQNEADHK